MSSVGETGFAAYVCALWERASDLRRLLALTGGRAVNDAASARRGGRLTSRKTRELSVVRKGGHNRRRYDGLLETITKPASVAGVGRCFGTYSLTRTVNGTGHTDPV